MAKRLVKGDKKLFGVCSGLANYFDMDPTVMRIIFLVGFFCFGTGLLLYLVLAVAMPSR
ncbi:MAG: PspC domain-containing protein [Bacteroidota bacterium]